MAITINEVVIEDGPLPEGDLFAYSYDPITSCVYLVKTVPNTGSLLNTSWGYVGDSNLNIVMQTLAPFPPPFYDANWFNPIDYAEDTGNGPISTRTYRFPYLSSETYTSIPDLTKLVKILDDTHAKPNPTCYSIALITQEEPNKQLFWRCVKEVRNAITGPPAYLAYSINKWVASEKVYKYKCGGIYFGGKDYSGPLNSILVDSADGVNATEYKILDMNEFKINANNEAYVDAYVCNYSTSASKVYCVLNKSTGRMAEIDVNSHTVKYFTVIVPVSSEICQLYYANRLMYTVRNATGTILSLYDANANGILMDTFTLGSYNPMLVPQFTIIN